MHKLFGESVVVGLFLSSPVTRDQCTQSRRERRARPVLPRPTHRRRQRPRWPLRPPRPQQVLEQLSLRRLHRRRPRDQQGRLRPCFPFSLLPFSFSS